MMRTAKIAALVVFFFCCCGAAAPVWAAPTQDQLKETSLHYYRGVVYYEAGRYDQALEEFQVVSAVDPYYKDTPKYIDNCIKVLEQYREDLIDRGLDKPSDKKTIDLYFLGKSYYEKGEFDKALRTFRAVLDKKPDDKFALYYIKLCSAAMPVSSVKRGRVSAAEERSESLEDLENEVAYIKSDIREQEDVEKFLRTKAERRASRDALIRAKERQLKEQEELLDEERQDYVTQAKITKQATRLQRETEKWRNKKERLASEQAGVPAELIEYPLSLDAGEKYYNEMKESLRTSRWNAAGLNAIQAGINYCDAVLIYFYGVRSAAPQHDNISRLLLTSVKRADVEANVSHVRSILNVKRIVEDEDRPFTRSEAIFLSEHAEKLVEWCRSLLP